MTPKLKYSDAHMPPVKQTFFRLTTPVTPIVKMSKSVQLNKKHYGADDANGETGRDIVARLLESISQTEEWQYIRMLMNEQPGTAGGGEVASEETTIPAAVDPEDDYREKMSAYHRLGQPERMPVLSYQKPREVDEAELYQQRREAYNEAAAAYGTFVESRKDIADRAAEYAMAHTCSYTEAIIAIGESMPNIPILTSQV